MTLLALDVQTLRKKLLSWSRSGFATKAINSSSTPLQMQKKHFSSMLCAEETLPFPRPLVCNRNWLYASPSFPPPNLAHPLIHQSGHGQEWNFRACTYLTSAPPPSIPGSAPGVMRARVLYHNHALLVCYLLKKLDWKRANYFEKNHGHVNANRL